MWTIHDYLSSVASYGAFHLEAFGVRRQNRKGLDDRSWNLKGECEECYPRRWFLSAGTKS
jgi:hypothetical protein